MSPRKLRTGLERSTSLSVSALSYLCLPFERMTNKAYLVSVHAHTHLHTRTQLSFKDQGYHFQIREAIVLSLSGCQAPTKEPNAEVASILITSQGITQLRLQAA